MLPRDEDECTHSAEGINVADEIQVGKPAPDFTLTAGNGKTVKLSELRGKRVVLYFYPKSFTPGCTKEACSLRDSYSDLSGMNVEVLGVSVDDADTQRRFGEEHGLQFPILADAGGDVARLYGVFGMTRADGTKADIARRVTFIIDDKGIVKKILDPAATDAAAEEVAAALAE
jgi:thioredoxin-dependent peroxiredoxin